MNDIFRAIRESSSSDLLEFCEFITSTHNVAKPSDVGASWIDIEAGELAEYLFRSSKTQIDGASQ